ncbi:MAG TPA: portal protein, partial [Rhizobacter sp.]|nr:portal protein [Rhizobacter sp.]
QVNELMFRYRYAAHSGYQAQQHDAYVSIGAFGTSCLLIDEFNDPTRPFTKGLRYRNIPLGELFFATNFQGQVDKAFRRFKLTLRQIAQKWGAEVLGDKYKGMLKEKPETEVTVIHCVKPNADYDPRRLDQKGKRFVSHYVLRETQTVLATGGYRCFPYAVARYLTAPGELYGRSPAMNVLPGIKVLNEEKKTVLKQGHRVVDPVLLAHDDGILEGFSLKAGAVNYGAVNSQGQKLVHTLETGNIAIGKELMDDERLAINDAFLVTLFQILVEGPAMTATEVIERAREKGALLSPTMGRYQSEGLGPMIEREFDVLMYQGLLPKPPRALMEAGGEYHAEYDAPLNRAMRAEEAAGGMRTFTWASEMAAQMQDPSILDAFDTDVMVPELADINGTPTRWLRSAEAIAERRKGREQEQAAAQITQALPGMAQMMKATNPEGTSTNVGQPA